MVEDPESQWDLRKAIMDPAMSTQAPTDPARATIPVPFINQTQAAMVDRSAIQPSKLPRSTVDAPMDVGERNSQISPGIKSIRRMATAIATCSLSNGPGA